VSGGEGELADQPRFARPRHAGDDPLHSDFSGGDGEHAGGARVQVCESASLEKYLPSERFTEVRIVQQPLDGDGATRGKGMAVSVSAKAGWLLKL
jgi:hypothetical protein